jgi:hypothetical protein
MPLPLLLAALVSQPPACASPVAPDEAAARRIAEAVISGRPRFGLNIFRVNVIPDPDHPGRWLAYQSVVPGVPPTGRATPSTRGGGGLAMRIDRCTGAVSDLHRQR